MIFEVDKDVLLKSISIADSVVSSRNVTTVLSSCLFTVTKDEIEIVATDNEIGIRTRFDAVADGECSFTVSGKRFSGILKELPKGEVTVEVSDSYMIDIRLKSRDIKAHYVLVGASSDEFPEVPVFYEEGSVEIGQDVLRDMLRRVIHAAALDTIKPVFNGVYLLSDQQGRLTAVATDSRRLSLISRPVESDIQLAEGIIIPLKTVHEVVRLLSQSGSCRFSLYGNQVFFKIGDTEIISRIIEGQFPNYKQVIPKEQGVTVLVDTRRLTDSLRRAMVFTREPANKVVLDFHHDSLVLEAKTADLGESTEEMPVESNGKDTITLGINAQFLMDVLKEVDSPAVSIGLTGHMSPVTLAPEGDTDFLSVIMPIQIKSG